MQTVIKHLPLSQFRDEANPMQYLDADQRWAMAERLRDFILNVIVGGTLVLLGYVTWLLFTV